MSYKIIYSKTAVDDLDDIFNYIAIDNYDKNSAKSLLKNITNSIDMIADYPELGKEFLLFDRIKTGYRYLVCKKYMIFYMFENNEVQINRIINSRRDYIKILFNK